MEEEKNKCLKGRKNQSVLWKGEKEHKDKKTKRGVCKKEEEWLETERG